MYKRTKPPRPTKNPVRSKYEAEYREKNPEKVLARRAVFLALSSGKMVAGPCIVCGKKKAEAHHEDYSKPLEVVWLCKKHHHEHHREEKEFNTLKAVYGEWP